MGQVTFSTGLNFLQLRIGIKYLDKFDALKLEQAYIYLLLYFTESKTGERVISDPQIRMKKMKTYIKN